MWCLGTQLTLGVYSLISIVATSIRCFSSPERTNFLSVSNEIASSQDHCAWRINANTCPNEGAFTMAPELGMSCYYLASRAGTLL